MSHRILKSFPVLVFAAGLVLASGVSRAAGVDESSAIRLAKQSGCFKCHTPDRAKEGPAWRDVAAKYKDMPFADAEKRLIHHITSGEMVKFKDGHEEHHKIVKSEDAGAIKNLIDWILSLKGGSYNGSYNLRD